MHMGVLNVSFKVIGNYSTEMQGKQMKRLSPKKYTKIFNAI